MPKLSPQARAHRADLAELARLSENDLAIMFRRFDSADAARQGLMDLLPQLIDLYGSAAATLGADWYDDLRDAKAVRGRFRAIPAELPGRDRTDALARWGIGPLFRDEPDWAIALSNVAGGLQRIIVNADRQTVMTSSVQDRGARGWQREGVGQCEFCRMLIDRGAVYTEATADFDCHDRCGCIGVPAF